MWKRLEQMCISSRAIACLEWSCCRAASYTSFAEQEGLSSREQARSLIKNAASIEYSVPESAVTVYVDDRRLTFPGCGTTLNVSFPFSDRSTSGNPDRPAGSVTSNNLESHTHLHVCPADEGRRTAATLRSQNHADLSRIRY